MAKVIWTEESLAWMEDIDRYLAKNSSQAAVQTIEGIIDRVTLVGNQPRIGGRLPRNDEREVRVTLFGKYRIAYEITSDETVYVLVIVHGSMDFDFSAL